ncbi:MAG: ORF6N domain-containing protein [Lachnospiraceae bacterium]|nr:ORF6N domain-containing protein [Lachnospiraceae bacterium]
MESRVNEIVLYEPIDKERIKAQIFDVRGYKVMLDSDIAVYFGVETKALNRAMKRNIKRFPDNFCFQLIREEYKEILRSNLEP